MKQFFKQNKQYTILLLILLIGAFLRFYKLDWGQGLFAHPDEYHISASVNQLSFPDQIHPHFFSYGTVTIYLIYFTQELLKSISSVFSSQFLVPSSFLLGRFYSALFSTLTIVVVYKICRTFLRTKLSLLAALLVALTPGLIQQSHFATPESALTFFLFTSLLFLTKFLKQNKTVYLTFASIFLGFALGVKISSIVFLLPLIATIAFEVLSKNHLRGARSGHLGGGEATTSTPPRWAMKKTKLILKLLLKFIGLSLVSMTIVFATFALVAPYVFLDFSAFRGNLEYEGNLALGKIPVFYTRQFIDTIPVFFQIEKIFPYALGPTLLVLGILGFVYLVISVINNFYPHSNPVESTESKNLSNETMKQFNNDRFRKDQTISNRARALIIVAFLSLFLPSAFLFAKWTRFIAPTFPFFAIFAVFFLQELKKFRILFYSLSAILLLATSLWTMAFFSIYTNSDIRITASVWLESNAKPESIFLLEGGNTVDLPLKGNFQRISLDFYALEDDPLTREKIVDALLSSDYFLVQSRRVFMNHQRLPNMFPETASFYDKLFNGSLGFKQIKTFYSYPRLSLLGLSVEFPDESAEETWSVFDHPVIRIFEKKVQLTKEDYAKFLDI